MDSLKVQSQTSNYINLAVTSSLINKRLYIKVTSNFFIEEQSLKIQIGFMDL